MTLALQCSIFTALFMSKYKKTLKWYHMGIGTTCSPRMISHDWVSYGYRQRATDKSDKTAAMTTGAASKEQNAALRTFAKTY